MKSQFLSCFMHYFVTGNEVEDKSHRIACMNRYTLIYFHKSLLFRWDFVVWWRVLLIVTAWYTRLMRK